MNRHNTNEAVNNNRKRPEIKVVFYCRVATAAQLGEIKTGLKIPSPVYKPEEMLRKNLAMELPSDAIRPVSRLEAILRKNNK